MTLKIFLGQKHPKQEKKVWLVQNAGTGDIIGAYVNPDKAEAIIRILEVSKPYSENCKGEYVMTEIFLNPSKERALREQ